MKKWIAWLTMLAVCLCAAGCVDSPAPSNPTEGSTASATTGATDATAQPSEKEETDPPVFTVPPTLDPDMHDDNTPGTIQVPGPDEIPGPPDADYSLPPGERPGDGITDAPKS